MLIFSDHDHYSDYGNLETPKVGLTFAPIDCYNIKRKNEINQADPAVVVGNLPTTGDPPKGQTPRAVPGSILYYDVDGNLATASVPYTNANKTTTNGWEFDIRHKFNAGSVSKFEANLNSTTITKFQMILNDGTTFDYVGTGGPYVLSSATGTPPNRGDLSVTWTSSDMSLTATIKYVDSMELIDHKGRDAGGQRRWELQHLGW